MRRRMANKEMVYGYMDGINADSPEPSGNRTASYRHGFQMGRNDLHNTDGDGYHANCDAADAAMKADEDAKIS